MPQYPYNCPVHGEFDVFKKMSESERKERCFCGRVMDRILTIPNITGTRDNFGVMKAFKDKETGIEINNFKTWEKMGYREPMESHLFDSNMKQEIKRKKEKILKYDSKKRSSVVMR